MTGVNDADVDRSAGVVGQIVDGKVLRCLNRCSVTCESGINVGGVAGSAENTEFEGCVNVAEVRGRSCVGGICGLSDIMWNSFSGCSNSGSVKSYGKSSVTWSGSNTSDFGVSGGIVGKSYDGDIVNCTNSGSVGGYDEVGLLCGGILGWGHNVRISSSKNKGTVEYYRDSGFATNAGAAGGIIGGASYSTVEQCYCTSGVHVGFDSYGMNNVGGIAGYGNHITLKNCWHSSMNSVNGYMNIGGIIGWADRAEQLITVIMPKETLPGRQTLGILRG